MPDNTIGERIATLRKKRGFTQKDLGDFLGVTDKAVSRWESGYGNPDITILPKLAKLLGTTTDYLLGGEAISQPEENHVTPSEKQNEKPLRVILTLSKVMTVVGAFFLCLILFIYSIPHFRAGQYGLFNFAVILTVIDALVCLVAFDVLNKARRKKDVIAAGVLVLIFCGIAGGVLMFCIPSREFYNPVEIYEDEKEPKGSSIKKLIGIGFIASGMVCMIVAILMFGTEFFKSPDKQFVINGYRVMFDYKNCFPMLFGRNGLSGSPFWLVFSYFFLYLLIALAVYFASVWIKHLIKKGQNKNLSFKVIIFLGTMMMVLGWTIATSIVSAPLYTEFAGKVVIMPNIDRIATLTIVGSNLAGVGFIIPLRKIKKKPLE